MANERTKNKNDVQLQNERKNKPVMRVRTNVRAGGTPIVKVINDLLDLLGLSDRRLKRNVRPL
jgi:hypothetical protein